MMIARLLILISETQVNLQSNKERGGEAVNRGAVGMYELFQWLRLVFFMRAPLLQEGLHRQFEHEVFNLPFLKPWKLNGTWERWCSCVRQFDKEIRNYERILSSPLCLMNPATDIRSQIAHLLEPVHVSCYTRSFVAFPFPPFWLLL